VINTSVRRPLVHERFLRLGVGLLVTLRSAVCARRRPVGSA
jgi:hypothetical protein